jgi:hypothetical protein
MATKRQKKSREPRANARMSDVSRRRFLQSVIAASAATGAAAALPAAAGSAPSVAAVKEVAGADIGAYQVLTEEQAGLLSAVLNRLIPAEGTMPAAGQIGLASYIDGVLADAPHLRQPILDIVHDVALAGTDAQSPEALDALLVRLEQTRPEAFASMINAVYTGYYSHPTVLQAIGWTHPGDEADTSETLDLALLDGVKSRGPIYRNV